MNFMDFQGIHSSLPVTQNDITINFVKTFSYERVHTVRKSQDKNESFSKVRKCQELSGNVQD